MVNGKRIIVSMTSWKKRLCNIAPVVYSLLRNTVQPDLIVCNLSSDELPGKEKELPPEVLLLQQKTQFEVHWVKRNTYTFKKFIPTLERFYPEDYYLFTVDDDELYDPTYIETGIEILKDHKAVVIAKRRPTATDVWGGMFGCQSNIFKPAYWKNITDELIKERMNDPYTNAYLDYVGVKVYNKLVSLTTKYNEICPNRGNASSYDPSKRDRVKQIVKQIFSERFV